MHTPVCFWTQIIFEINSLCYKLSTLLQCSYNWKKIISFFRFWNTVLKIFYINKRTLLFLHSIFRFALTNGMCISSIIKIIIFSKKWYSFCEVSFFSRISWTIMIIVIQQFIICSLFIEFNLISFYYRYK